jgi:hypothetical protein
MFKKIISIIIGLTILIIPSLAKADGGIFPRPNYYASETDQKAVIAYQNNTETLVLSVTFKGDPKDFGWIVPVPNKPTVDKSTDSLFSAMFNKTIPPTNNYGNIPLVGSGFSSSQSSQPLSVNVIETKQIDEYDIATISSTNSKDLTTWLTQNGYQIPTDATNIFNYYIKNSWYFTCIKIDLSKITDVQKGELATGHGTPLKFQFQSDQIIFPLKLTAILADYQSSQATNTSGIQGLTTLPQVSFVLYVLADGKKTIPNFTTDYANWLKKDEIESLAYNSDGSSWYKTTSSKMFLTKFSATLKTSDMKDDLVFKNAPNNDTINVASKSIPIDVLIGILVFVFAFLILILSPIGIVFLILFLIQLVAKSKTWQIILWIFQILDLLVTIFVSLVVSLIALQNFGQEYIAVSISKTINLSYVSVGLIAACVGAIVSEILLLVWQHKKHKIKNTLNQKNSPQKKAEEIFNDKDKK